MAVIAIAMANAAIKMRSKITSRSATQFTLAACVALIIISGSVPPAAAACVAIAAAFFLLTMPIFTRALVKSETAC